MAERGREEEWIREQSGCKCLSIWVILGSFSEHGVMSHELTSWILRVTASAGSVHLTFSWLSRCYYKAFFSYLVPYNLEVKYHLHVYIQNPLNVLNDGHYVSNCRVAKINSIVTIKGMAAEMWHWDMDFIAICYQIKINVHFHDMQNIKILMPRNN